MRIAIAYALMSVTVAAAAVGMYLFGPDSNAATIVLGFIASVFAGAGLLAVYPFLMSRELAEQRAQAGQ